MPTDWPRIQSASKLSTVSTALRRSVPLPWISTRLRAGSTRTLPGFTAKLSSSLASVAAETYCSGTTVMPKPGSARAAVSTLPVPTASEDGTTM